MPKEMSFKKIVFFFFSFVNWSIDAFGFPGSSVVKNLSAVPEMQEMNVHSLGP